MKSQKNVKTDKKSTSNYIFIIYKLVASLDMKKIIETPYGYTLTEIQAKEYINNYSPFRYKKGDVSDIRKYELPVCILRKHKDDTSPIDYGILDTDEILILPSVKYLPYDISNDELKLLKIDIKNKSK
jgi:hypothetical protein